MRSISECIEEAIERVRNAKGILDIESTAQHIALECNALESLDEIAETLLREGMHHRVPMKMDHVAANRNGQPPQS